MKRLVASHSQHFLRNPAFIAELVGHSNVRKNDTVIDIGAGSGAITAVLARRCRQVIAYETETHALEALRRNMERYENVTIEPCDFLGAPPPDGRYKVFANIPFDLSSPIVRKLTNADNPPVSIYLIVQKQFAQKMLLGGTHFHGSLGMGIAPWWTARIRRPLRKSDFTPPPAVDTVLLEIKRRETPLLPIHRLANYMAWIESCYHDPKVYAKANPPVGMKPSQLTVEQWVQLFRRHI